MVTMSSFLIFLMFSLTLSEITIVSLIEKPMIVRMTARRGEGILQVENGDGAVGDNDIVEECDNPAKAVGKLMKPETHIDQDCQERKPDGPEGFLLQVASATLGPTTLALRISIALSLNFP